MVECLTSYINRLAWSYRISPHILVAQEIVPHLSRSYSLQSSPIALRVFSQQRALSINGVGETSTDWFTTVEKLTKQPGLRKLTLGKWTSGLPYRRLLRAVPAWCPSCYTEWQAKNVPIYQPLIWMLRIATSCVQHRRKLEEQCSRCQNRQLVFPSKTQPGHCTQCGSWLGLSVEVTEESEIEEEELAWQVWVVKTIEELRTVSVTSDTISWKRIGINLASCLKVRGDITTFSRSMGVSKSLISDWQRLENTPSFLKVLEICYAIDISPLQLMSGPADMRNAMQAISEHPRRRPVHHGRWLVNREEIREELQAMLDGRKPCRAIQQIARDLGVASSTLQYNAPLECSLVSKQYQAQRVQEWRQCIAQACDEVRQVAPALHAQGIYPSRNRVMSHLSIPSMMRDPEVYATWHAVLCELGMKE
jgi:transcriptional regulator with XRE-family HTH domain